MIEDQSTFIRIFREWKNQAAANDIDVPETYIPLESCGKKFDQDYKELSGLGIAVREYKPNVYSIGRKNVNNS
jgi:hypothetical protein